MGGDGGASTVGASGSGAGGWVSAGASILSILGSASKATAATDTGKAAQAAANFQADQYRVNAGQQIAMSQRASDEEKRKATLLASRALAVAAASGAKAGDTTVQGVIADLTGEGVYRSMLALYEGQDRARTLRMAGESKEYEGKLARVAGKQVATGETISGLASGLKLGTTLFEKFGGGGPGTDTGKASGVVHTWDPDAMGSY